MTTGFGKPDALQKSVTLSPSVFVWFVKGIIDGKAEKTTSIYVN